MSTHQGHQGKIIIPRIWDSSPDQSISFIQIWRVRRSEPEKVRKWICRALPDARGSVVTTLQALKAQEQVGDDFHPQEPVFTVEWNEGTDYSFIDGTILPRLQEIDIIQVRIGIHDGPDASFNLLLLV